MSETTVNVDDHTTIPETVHEGYVYAAVPAMEAPPAYVPGDAKVAAEKAPVDNNETEEQEDKEPQEFELGLFGCIADPALCLPVTFCAPCMFARTSRTMARAEGEDPAALAHTWGAYLNWKTMWYVLSAVPAHGLGNLVWRTVRRGQIRERYEIKGSTARDFLAAALCGPCALAQEHHEVVRRETSGFRKAQAQVESQYLV